MPTILITRPSHLGRTLAEKLGAIGYTVLEYPLLEIVPQISPRPSLSTPMAVMITSRSAIWALRQEAPPTNDLLDLPCYCVGEKTAEDARAYGFKKVFHAPDGNGKALAALVGQGADGEILHICGKDLSAEPLGTLLREGWHVRQWSVYKARKVQEISADIRDALYNRQIAAALFFSLRSAKHFADLIARTRLEACCKGLLAVGLSEAALEGVAALPGLKMVAAVTPTQEGMIASLQRSLSVEKREI